MSSNKYLSAFFTSAAALGGLYLLDRFLGGEARANPSRPRLYTHRKTFEEFTPTEREDIARKYTENNQSVSSIAKEYGASTPIIRQILEAQRCDIRDCATANALARKIELTDDQKQSIRTQWKDDATRPTLGYLAASIGVSKGKVISFLVEEGLHEVKTREIELTDEDKEKLVATKEAANRKGIKLNFGKLGKELKLDHEDVTVIALLRFFAERGLNCYFDYTGTLDADQQDRILSYFKDGEQTVTIIDIAEREGVGPTQVHNFLYSHNILPRPSGSFKKIHLDDKQKGLMISLFEDGKTNKEIADIMGISLSALTPLIEEYRASQGITGSRRQESKIGIRSRLVSRDPEIIRFIMAERAKSPPTSYENIGKELRKKKGVSSGYSPSLVHKIHLEELSKRK